MSERIAHQPNDRDTDMKKETWQYFQPPGADLMPGNVAVNEGQEQRLRPYIL